MKKLFFVFSLTFSLACTKEKAKMPANLLPPEKLTSILADIHVAESRVEAMVLRPDTAKVVYDSLQQEIFKKQGVTKEAFDQTYGYYLENLPQLDKVYERLVDTLGMREVKMQSK